MKIKRALILYKQSTYSHFFLGKGKKNPFLRHPIAKRFIQTHQAHHETLNQVEAFLKLKDIPYEKLLRGRSKDFTRFDLIITIGGDGTFLEGASRTQSQLILGINSDPMWSVGRFCYGNQKNFKQIIQNILNTDHRVRILNRMKITFKQSKKDFLVLNDILVCHRNPAAMSRYELEFKKTKEEQRSSGVWVATAAGSTGAIRSAGGKVLPEESKCLQFVVRELYCGKSGKPRQQSAVFNGEQPLKITSLIKDGVVYVDGSHRHFAFPFGEVIHIRNSSHPIYMVIQ